MRLQVCKLHRYEHKSKIFSTTAMLAEVESTDPRVSAFQEDPLFEIISRHAQGKFDEHWRLQQHVASRSPTSWLMKSTAAARSALECGGMTPLLQPIRLQQHRWEPQILVPAL
jgi:hypothetical protein